MRFGWDEPIVWQWLEAQKQHGYFGQSAQLRLEWAARSAGTSEEFENKVRGLAGAPCPPPLRYCVGKILRARGKTQEGARMMAEAYAAWPRDAYPEGRTVGEELLRIHLAQADITSAEKVLKRLLDDPVCGDSPGWLGKVAVVAARERAPDLAMRLWRKKAALDLTDQAGLEDLASNGLAQGLHNFYSALALRAPDNPAIAAALKKLGRF